MWRGNGDSTALWACRFCLTATNVSEASAGPGLGRGAWRPEHTAECVREVEALVASDATGNGGAVTGVHFESSPGKQVLVSLCFGQPV